MHRGQWRTISASVPVDGAVDDDGFNEDHNSEPELPQQPVLRRASAVMHDHEDDPNILDQDDSDEELNVASVNGNPAVASSDDEF